jgi:hypothetical protein
MVQGGGLVGAYIMIQNRWVEIVWTFLVDLV